MSITTGLKARDDYRQSDIEALRELKEAVYPPEEHGDWEGSTRDWAGPQWGVFVWDDTGQLVSYTGVVRREGAVDGDPTIIGGVGGIATHPDHRRRGYAALGMGRALDHLLGIDTDFALLVCRDELVPYYQGLGWRLFEGTVVNTQFGEPETFTFNRVMVGDLISTAPSGGIIDLKGPPW